MQGQLAQLNVSMTYLRNYIYAHYSFALFHSEFLTLCIHYKIDIYLFIVLKIIL